MLSCLILAGLVACAIGDPTPSTLSTDQLIQNMFQRGDANKDGIYSKAEAWAVVLSIDSNGDKQVSKEEYVSRWAAVSPALGKVGAALFDKLDLDDNNIMDQRDVNAAYALVDTDSNGQVTSSEFGDYMGRILSALTPSTPLIPQAVIDASFTLVDTNNDGFISFDEAWADAKNYDLNDDDQVEKVEFMLAIANNTMGLENWPDIFDGADFNGDRVLDKTDIMKFYKMEDADGNGKVSKAELTALLGRFNELLAGRNTSQDYLDYGFADGDKNKDGKMTLDEYWANVLLLDNNSDSTVSQAEFMAIFQMYPADVKIAAQKVFQMYDTDNNGNFEKANIATFFNAMDIDGDGFISRNTFTTHIEVIFRLAGADIRAASIALNSQNDFGFSEADKNHDGLLTIDEQWNSALPLDKDGDGRLSKAEYLVRYANLPPNIQATAPKIFDRFDFDKNGYLEKTDAIKGFPMVDTSGDGFISLSEYISFVYKLYASFGVNLQVNRPNTSELVPMDAFDIRTDAQWLTCVPIERYSEVFRILGRGKQVDFGFSMADTNHDGVLSVDEEWVAALALDTNGDGKVSRDEYLVSFANQPANIKAVGSQMFDIIDYDNSTFLEKSDLEAGFKMIDISGDGKVQKSEFVTAISNLYASVGLVINLNAVQLDFGFDSLDTNHDGVVSVDEQWAVAQTVDKNGDGKLSMEEYVATFAEAAPAMKAAAPLIFAQIDADNSSFIEKSDVKLGFSNIDTSGDGKIQKSEYVSFFTQLYASFGISINPDPTNEADFGFNEADTNHDGILTVDEQWTVALTLDKNGDGKLSSQEYAASFSLSPPNYQALAPTIFDKFDSDNSSFLERSDVARAFTALDTSGDGRVTKSEYVTYLTNYFTGLGLMTSNITTTDYGFSEIDTNNDGQVNFDEEWAFVVKGDTDGDNRVSQAEYIKYVGPSGVASVGAKIFTRFDADKNGFFEKDDIRKFIVLVDTNGDGTMSSSEYSSFVATLLTSLGVDLSSIA